MIRIYRDATPATAEPGAAAPVNVTPAAPAANFSSSAPIFTQGAPADEAAAAAAKASSETFLKTIPETYRDKPYMKGIDSPEKLLSAFDGAQKLIGTRPNGIPAADAPKETWDAFYKSLGKPDTFEAYQVKPVEGLKYDDGFLKVVKDVFHKANLTQAQVDILQPGFDQALLARAKATGAATAQADVDFDKLGTEVFGPERDAKLERANKIMAEHAPQSLLKHLGNLTNEQLIIMGGIVDSIATKFIAPDKLPQLGNGQQQGAFQSMEKNREEARRLMLTPEFNNPFHPDHEKVKKQVSDLYAPLRGQPVAKIN